ncbi:TrkH family potassium uptake protein [Bacillus sp. FJAT-49732]|uniref:TrkH family potassium uptake protein n=1 Tax=Lederbergia citrisecunda TaxID=2833583 RepID=A0A942TJE2_9BACI|nr:TrkH family potassium uptake protein [Lederbergia citrisecunda]MBS4198715.1 TrkH family potassium uptake protein [Lederbergia citrisecunda]
MHFSLKRAKELYHDVKWKRINPAQTLALGFFFLIIIGTLLLMLPFATKDRHHLDFIDALFEATSAICVTGLIVVDTETTFTLFGQIVLMILIQIGGLGFMSLGILIALFLGKNIGLKRRLLIQESWNLLSIGGIIKVVKFVFRFTIIIEGIGAIILAIRWGGEYGFPLSIYYGIFHSISAFNNAGFDLMGHFQSVTKYAGDFTIILTLSSLLIIGGIGYTVFLDVVKKKSIKKLSLHSKIVLLTTLILNVLGTLLIFTLEYHNPGTIGDYSLKDKILSSYFQAVVPRTAGFNAVNMSELTLSSQFITIILMFIGGGSGGTAGGIKVTTFAIILLAVWNHIRGHSDVNIMERRIPKDLIYKAFTITVYSVSIVLLILFILTLTEKAPMNVLLFEVVSAFGTVGISLGLTPELSDVGKVVISILMFMGRVGPLTIAFALAKANNTQPYKYPEERIMLG